MSDFRLLFFISIAIIFILAISFMIYLRMIKSKCSYIVSTLENKNDYLIKEYAKKEELLQKQIQKKEDGIERREKIVKEFVESLDKEIYCAELISDFKTIIYDEYNWLAKIRYSKETLDSKISFLKEDARKHIIALKKYKYKEKERILEIENNAQQKIEKIERILESKTPFHEVAQLYSDALAVAYANIADELNKRARPAYSTAYKIEQVLKEKIKEASFEAKELKYRLDFITSSFPEFNDFIFDDEAIISMSEYENINGLNDVRDKARDYLSDEEYSTLPEVQKYQRALDNYKSKHKPNAWIAGVEYEMYCCHLLRHDGYKVIDYGVKMRKSDLGRDLIAYKDGITYIIQCKRYSLKRKDGSDKYVHENVVCQLYGTAIEYQIANQGNALFANQNKVIPVLYTTGRLSDMAMAFANRLNIKVVTCEMGEYPMIKCNVNKGEHIYHLPFDQQYWNTTIENEGDFYAWTVQEAVDAGFRRAMRWRGNVN